MIRPIALGLCLGLSASAAAARPSVCWIENSVLLVPAVAAGVNGVFVLDTGAARSQLDATQASEADVASDPEVRGEVRVAGRVFPGVRMQVLALDERTRDFPTPIAGVLGADILAGQVLTVRPSPCRVSLSPARGGRRGQAITLRNGAPLVKAAISDGANSRTGVFRIDTGSPAPIALSAGSVDANDHRLRALSLDGRLFENIVAVPKAAGPDGALDAIGEPIWSRFTLRLDFRRRTLTLGPP